MPPPAPSVAGQRVLRRGFRVLGRAIQDEPRIFALSVAGSALFGAMTIAQAYVFGAVTGRVIEPALRSGHTTAGALVGAFCAILAVATFKVVGIIGRRLGAGVMQYRLQATYRRRVTRRYLDLPMAWHQQHPTGELMSNANSDVEAAWFPIAPFPFAVGVVAMVVVTLALLFATDPVLALVGSVVFPAIAFLTVAYSRAMSPLMTRAQQLRGEVSTVAHESFDGGLVVKTLGREPEETARFRTVSEELRDTMVSIGRVRGFFDPLMESLPVLGVLLVLTVGSSRVGSGHLTSAELVRVSYLFTLLGLPLRAIGWVLNELPRSVVGWDRLQAVLTATGRLDHGPDDLPGSGEAVAVELRSVAFSYGDTQVLHGVDVVVPAGRTVALVGPTGSGKSTVASILVRLVDPDAGAVGYDGVELRSLAPGVVAGVASLVPQQTFLFDDTVRDNVTLGASFSDDEVWAALRLAQAESFVRALPEELDTQIGERGASLSGGQRQRLALARALVRRPRLLVLDDATSSVDPSVEQRILAGLRSAELASTVVVIAYRRATIALADEVVYLDEGRVLGRGTHEDLVMSCPGYAELVTAYARAEAERAAVEVVG